MQVSSLHLNVLKNLRKLDKNLYLGYIFLPNKHSVKNKINQKASSIANKFGLQNLKAHYQEKYQDRFLNEYDKYSFSKQIERLKMLKNALGSNFGFHLDFEDAKKHLEDLKNIDKNIKIYVYSLNKIDPEIIEKYFKKYNIRLDGIITDSEPKQNSSSGFFSFFR